MIPTAPTIAEPAASTYEDWVLSAIENCKAAPRREQGFGLQRFSLLLGHLAAYVASPEALADGGEKLTRTVWIEMFKLQLEGVRIGHLDSDLLAGLFTNNRWQSLFDSDAEARSLVLLTTRYLDNYMIFNPLSTSTMWARIVTAWSEWLEPGVGAENATVRSIIAALFGEPWCALVYDVRGESVSLTDLITLHAPEFLPGRLKFEHRQTVEHLPDLSYGPA